MKKILSNIGVFAAAALTFLSCNKDVVSENQDAEITHVVTINLGKADGIKTAVIEGETEASYIWSAEDKQYFHVYESANGAKATEGSVDNVVFSEDMKTASLSVSFTGTATGPYTYSVIYANAFNINGNPRIPAEQNPLAANFDPAADVLISKTVVSEKRAVSMDMTMGRVATVNKMTLKGLQTDEKVSKVELELSKSISADYVLTSGNFSPTNKKLTFSYSNAAVGEDGTFPVYFIAAPVEAAEIVSVIVTTDKNVYTKSSSLDPNPFDGKTISFKIGTMKRFSMDMTGYGEPISEATEYVLVESEEKIADGAEYIIVNKDGTKALAGYTISNDKSYFGLADVKLTDKIISITSEQANRITLEASGTAGQFYMKTSDGKYIYYTGSENVVFCGEKEEANGYLWTVLYNKVTNVGTTERVLQFNKTNTRFACYKSTMEDVTLYVNEKTLIPSLATPTNLEAIDVEGSVMVSWDSVENAQSYTVTCGEQSQDVPADENPSAIFDGLADGLYEISVIATTTDAGFKNSAPAVTSVRVGTVAKAKVYFSVNSAVDAGTELEEGASISFPTDPEIAGVSFMGWTASAISGTQADAPAFVETAVMGTEDITYYAVFATQNGSAASEKLKYTLAYDTWTYSGSTTNKNTYRLFHSGSYIESEAFDLSSLRKVVVYGGTFGGASYNKLTIGDGTNTWKSVIVSGNSETGVNTYTDGTPLTGNGKLRVTSNSGTASSNGVRISKVEIYVIEGGYTYSDYCTSVVTLSSLAVSGTATKTAYTNGDSFDPDGLTVTAKYSDDSEKEITSGFIWSIDPATLTVGTTSVSVKAIVGSVISPAYQVSGLTVSAAKLDSPANLTCKAQTENSLTFTWEAVANASGYQVSRDGVKYEETQDETEYTWTGLSASTEYTLYVKAVGDNSSFTDSDAVSAKGTTTASSSEGGDTKFFVKVTSTPTDWSGEYLIVYETGAVAFDGSLTTLDAAGNTVGVTISDGTIEATDELLKSVFTIDGSSIKSKSGYYIGRTATSNGFNSSSSTAYTHTLSFDSNGNFVVTSSGGPKLQYYSSGDDSRFRYYKSTQQSIQLYKLTN